MFNFTDPSLATVLFTSFLLRHLNNINPPMVVFMFEEKSAFQVDYISKSITGYKQMHFNVDKQTQNEFVADGDVLLINFGHLKGVRKIIQISLKNFRQIIIETSPFNSGIRAAIEKRVFKRSTQAYELSVYFLNTTMIFVSWNRNRNIPCELHYNEQSLLSSFSWMAFLRNVTKLPENEWLRATDIILEDTEGEAANELAPKSSPTRKELAYVSGFRIGIYKILAEKISSSAMTYKSSVEFISYPVQFKRLPPARLRDKRLNWRYWKDPNMNDYLSMSFSQKYSKVVYTTVHQTRYRLLVPRIIENSQSSDTVFTEILRKCVVLLCVLVVGLVFASLRYACKWLTNDRQNHSVADLFFDTVIRLLGNSSGVWLGRSTSERQLLTVIAIESILMDSIFLGVLYEKMFVEFEINYRYNNLNDVCRDGLNLGVTVNIAEYFRLNEDEWSNCIPSAFSQDAMEMYGAFIYEEATIDETDYWSKNYMLLPGVYAIQPGKIEVSDVFLAHPIWIVLERCVEHGIWAALRSSTDHLQMIIAHQSRLQTINDESTQQVTPFEYFVLAFGLVLSGIVFGLELLLNKFHG